MKVYRDAWGIPHLRAGDAAELAFLQGRNAAEDRAWQIELERHRSQGTTAAFLGSAAVDWDRFVRRARLDDTARRCFHSLDEETRAWLTAYVDGVNAGLHRGAPRAPEFTATGLTPGRWQPWTPLAIWLTVHVLFAGFPNKLWREQVARHLGAGAIELFATEGPAGSGSNGWLVSGEHTVTGAPIVAGDPHRFIENPGVYQQIHLACPEFDVVGMAVPGIPGVAHFGHTGGVAWAITNAMADYQDVYQERLRRHGPDVQALGPDGWRPAAVHTESVEVAGGDPVEVEVIETDRGPVVIGGPDEQAISLRHPPRVRAELGFGALPALLRATTVADVDRAFSQWVEPVNVVLAADTRGGLLHRVAGRVPVRDHGNRLRVVPAWEPGHEWQGWHDPMPRAEVDGIAVMANERGLAEPLAAEFAAPHRARRIRRLLVSREGWSAKDMYAVHTDTQLPSAQRLLGLVDGLDGLGPEAARLRDRLLRWDRRMDADSTDASAYAAVRSAVVRRLAAHPLLARLAEPAGYPETFAAWLDLVPRIALGLENLLTTEMLPEVTGIARAALEDVAARPEAPEPWGRTHRLEPWQAVASPPIGEVAVSGDHDCVLSTSSLPGITDRFTRGPVARYVWDLARRADSLWSVPLGASGVPGDPHHHDQLALWARGELVPVVTDWSLLTEDVDEQTVDGLGTVPVDPGAIST